MENIKISIVLPFFGVEKYIEECLRSLVSQTLREIEIICIDDQSPDRSRIIVEEFMKQDPRIRLLVNEQNMGVAVSRNRGMEEARGEYVYIMDSDDFLRPDAMEKMYEQARRDDADLVIADAFNYYEDGRCEYYFNPFKFRPLLVWTGHAAWWYIFKRSLIEEHTDVRFPANAHPGEDTAFSFMLFSFVQKYSDLEMPILYYRQHENMCMRQLDGAKSEQYFQSLSICFDHLITFMHNHPKVRFLRNDAFLELMRVLTKETCNITGQLQKKLPARLRYTLKIYVVRRFFFQWKITRSGYVIVKIIKIPVLHMPVARFQRLIASLARA